MDGDAYRNTVDQVGRGGSGMVPLMSVWKGRRARSKNHGNDKLERGYKQPALE